MRVLAYYGPNDLREEEWPKPQPGFGQVRVAIKSVCLSTCDVLHYTTGGFGDLALPRPFVFGQDAAGLIDAVGAGVQGLKPGMPVVLDPVLPNDQILGWPPTQGALAEYIVVPARNAVPIEGRYSFAELACIPALAVVEDAFDRCACDDHIVIVGAGYLGLLCLLTAQNLGVASTAVIDAHPGRLAHACQFGANDALANVAQLAASSGTDHAEAAWIFECSGTDEGLAQALDLAAPCSDIMLLGMTAARTLALPMLPACLKEVQLHCCRHAQPMHAQAPRLVQSGKLNLAPLITHRIPWDKAEDAFALAAQPDGDAIRISLEPEELDEPFHP
ncbi:MAG: alcohol dehydrogenase catalytic domain-containing protein [bacterium]|nr:alcohol dehydrogenase catalytic domain-containing protein [bacterium]